MIFFSKRKYNAGKNNSGQAKEKPRSLSYHTGNVQGIGRRERQEDSFAFSNALDVTRIRKEGLLAIMADGMGGMKGGKTASENAVSVLKDMFDCSDKKGDVTEWLNDAVCAANEKVYRLLKGEGGSTVIACIMYKEYLYYASVGDSFLFLKRDGYLYRINELHNVRNEDNAKLIRQGRMLVPERQWQIEDGALTQFLGMPGRPVIDSFSRAFPLRDDDIILICSDGVGAVLPEEEICMCLEQSTPDQMCKSLEERVLQKGSLYQDNYTALVIHCKY